MSRSYLEVMELMFCCFLTFFMKYDFSKKNNGFMFFWLMGENHRFGWCYRVDGMEKHIQASQRFLLSIRTLASVEDARCRQYTHLGGVIARAASLSTASLADLISSLDPQVWTKEQLEGLKTGLAEKLADCKERRPMQDYVCFPLYLDQQWWNMLQTTSSQAERFERLCRHVLSLGMRCPSEPTVAALVWLACCAFRAQDMTDAEKRSLLKEYKPKLKKWISQVEQPPVYLTVLPAVVADCPVPLLASAYPGGFQEYTPPGWSYEHYENMVRQFPLRQRKEVPTEKSNTSEGRGFFEMGRLLAGFAESGMFGRQMTMSFDSSARDAREAPREDLSRIEVPRASVAPLALEDIPRADTSLRETKRGEPSSNTSLRETMAPPVSPRETREAQQTASAELAALRGELFLQDQVAADADAPGSMKRPAGKVSAKPQKKPAAGPGSAGSKKGPVCKVSASKTSTRKMFKKPAAAVPRGRRAATGQDLRDRLLASVPEKLKREHKNGCSSCRYRPYCCNSCWIKRGFSI